MSNLKKFVKAGDIHKIPCPVYLMCRVVLFKHTKVVIEILTKLKV